MKRLSPSDLKLVLAGEELVPLPQHSDIVVTGFLEEADKHAAIAESLALVQPSYFESFSIVLCEAWVQRRPAIVQGASTVLRGQARRSNGAVPYEGFAEYEQAVSMLVESPDLVDELGRNGRLYVQRTYAWSEVIAKFEESINEAQSRFNERIVTLRGRD